VEPCAYVPSNMDEQDVRWLIYYYFVIARTRAAAGLSPALYSLYARTYRLFSGRNPFLVCESLAVARMAFLPAAVTQAILAPQKIPSFIRCIRFSSFTQTIRLHYIALQAPPLPNSMRPRRGEVTPFYRLIFFAKPFPHYLYSIYFHFARVAHGVKIGSTH
jgi:hypothetical protein